jgi:predicted MFS family arabinose efflux permease
MSLRQRIGALTERNFRIVFSSTTVSALGDGVSTIALAFAVLQISDSPAALGAVIAARQIASAAITVAAGVWADRLPRHLVLVGAALLQCAVQAVSGTLVLTGHATVLLLAVLGLLFGLADGFVIPASQGLIPTIVSASRLQQANALIGLSRSILGVAGPALGGLLVAVGSPGAALLVDAATFAVAAMLLLRLSIAPRGEGEVGAPSPFLHELREGWREFRRQTWIWTTIVFFGIGNFAGASYFVLGPVVAKRDLGGAAAWATIVSAFGVGSILGGLLALHLKPRRQLLASCVAAIPYGLQTLAIGAGLPLPALVAVSAAAGVGIAVHLALWFTVFQQQVPEAARSRVSSYDALGSFVLIPLGSALAGPVASLVGISTTLVGSGLISLACIAVVIAQPSVRALRSDPAPAARPQSL